LLWPRITEERTGFLGRGREAKRIEVGAAQEHAVGAERGWLYPQGPQLGEDVMVDVVRLRHLLPREHRPCWHEFQLHRGVLVEVAHQDGRFTHLLPAHLA